MDSSDSDDDVIVSSLMLVASTLYRRWQLRVRTRNRTIWALHWISKREEYGAYNGLVREIRVNDTTSCRNFLRMDDVLLSVHSIILIITNNLKQLLYTTIHFLHFYYTHAANKQELANHSAAFPPRSCRKIEVILLRKNLRQATSYDRRAILWRKEVAP